MSAGRTSFPVFWRLCWCGLPIVVWDRVCLSVDWLFGWCLWGVKEVFLGLWAVDDVVVGIKLFDLATSVTPHSKPTIISITTQVLLQFFRLSTLTFWPCSLNRLFIPAGSLLICLFVEAGFTSC